MTTQDASGATRSLSEGVRKKKAKRTADGRTSGSPAERWTVLAAGLAEQAYELLRDWPHDDDATRRAHALATTAIAMALTKEGA